MNKVISILATTIVVFFISASMASCNKNDPSASLEGTTWTGTENTHGFTYYYTLTFGKSSFSMKFTVPNGSNGGTETETFAGTYTYDPPVVTLVADINGEKTILTGAREGNTITFTGEHGVTFTKQ